LAHCILVTESHGGPDDRGLAALNIRTAKGRADGPPANRTPAGGAAIRSSARFIANDWPAKSPLFQDTMDTQDGKSIGASTTSGRLHRASTPPDIGRPQLDGATDRDRVGQAAVGIMGPRFTNE